VVLKKQQNLRHDEPDDDQYVMTSTLMMTGRYVPSVRPII
jgi:hypothetical protein